MFSIEHIPIEGDVFLSPMAGVSDSPNRLLCRQMGAGFSFTEFVSADKLSLRDPKALDLFRFDPRERPVIFQIFGSDPKVVGEAARIAEELEPDVIDLNMGCSVRHISGKGCGAGLLRDPLKAGRMIAAMRKAVSVPVTAKIRIGWNEQALNYLEVAHILEDSGAAMISVHGRTKDQAYKGLANWDAIGEIKARAQVPVLGNGDVTSYDQARERMRTYGVDGVLVGRGAMGNPWIFGGRDRAQVSRDEVLDVLLRHCEAMLDFFPGPHALVMFRKHARGYLKDFDLAPEYLRGLSTTESADDFRARIAAIRAGAGRGKVAAA